MDMVSHSITIGTSKLLYVLKRSKKRKRTIALSIEPDLSVQVVAPLDTSFEAIEKIIRKRSAWLFRKIADMREFRSSLYQREFVSGETISLLGKQYLLRVIQDASIDAGCSIKDNFLQVNIHNTCLVDENLRQKVRLEIALWYKKQAGKKFVSRIAYWSKKLGLISRSLIVSNPKKRWGSCDHKDNIRLNWRIVMAPLSFIDYVIAHELCHVKYKNHSAEFWQLLGSIMPNYDARKVELRKIGVGYDFS
jgi:predicted metal-dependent hydrolase